MLNTVVFNIELTVKVTHVQLNNQFRPIQNHRIIKSFPDSFKNDMHNSIHNYIHNELVSVNVYMLVRQKVYLYPTQSRTQQGSSNIGGIA